MKPTEFDKAAHQIIVAKAPVFRHRNKTNVKPIPAKKLAELQRQFHSHIANIKVRNDWLEATKRKNYEHEYDRLHGAVKINPYGVGVDALKNRMTELKQLVDKSLNEPKHEIYSKGQAENAYTEVAALAAQPMATVPAAAAPLAAAPAATQQRPQSRPRARARARSVAPEEERPTRPRGRPPTRGIIQT